MGDTEEFVSGQELSALFLYSGKQLSVCSEGFLCSRVLFLCSLCIFLELTRILELTYGKRFDFYYFTREGLEKQMNLVI